MKNLKLALALAGALLLSKVPAIAQTPNITGNTFQTGQAGKTVTGFVGMCVNGSNVAVPCGTGGTGTTVVQGTSPWVVTGAGGTFPVTGTFWPYALGQSTQSASVPTAEASDSPLVPFAANPVATITRSGNTTTYTANTGWNNGTPTFFSFTSACRIVGGQVLIPSINIWSSANPTLKLTGVLWLFASVPGTNVSDNATFTIASADFTNLTGSKQGFPFTLTNAQVSTGAANSSATLSGVTYQGKCASGTTTITGMVEVTNAYVPANAEILSVGLNTIGAN